MPGCVEGAGKAGCEGVPGCPGPVPGGGLLLCPGPTRGSTDLVPTFPGPVGVVDTTKRGEGIGCKRLGHVPIG
jgi:hypothetical protein